MKEDNLIINYIDAPPGAGKTRACIEMMRQHIEKGGDGEEVGYIFYVAPTTGLLDQTAENLLNEIPDNLKFMLRKVYSKAELQGNKTETWVCKILDEQRVSNLRYMPFVQGSVLFITHATFIKLRKHPKFAQTTVIFDESRKWVHKHSIKMDRPGVKQLFESLFSTQPIKSFKGINKIRPRKVAENQKRKLLATKDSVKEFSWLDEMHKRLLPSKGPVRMSVYAVMKGTTMVQIMLPSHPFVGFRDVYVMSAAFENSQMFYLFRSEDCMLKNRTLPFMNKYLKGGYVAALEEIHNRQSYLYLVALSPDKGVPSKYQYNSGILVPKGKLVEMKKKMVELSISTGVLRDVVNHLRDPQLSAGVLKLEQKKILKYLRDTDCKLDILQWQIESSEKIIKRWFKKCGKPGKALLFVNSDRNPAYDRKIFTKLSIGKAEGNNQYQSRNVVTFLAAVNPEQEIRRTLEALLPGYRPDVDYVVDKAIQCIGRGNIRTHGSSDKMLAIVPTLGMANSISFCMKDSPTVDIQVAEKLGNYVPWSYHQAFSNEEDATVRAKAALKKHLSDPINKKLASLRTMRGVQRRKGNLEKVEEIELKIKELVAERARNK